MFASLLDRGRHSDRWIVAVFALVLVVGATWGVSVFGQLTGGAGFENPRSESVTADDVLANNLGRNVSDLVVLYTSDNGTRVDDPAFRSSVEKTVNSVPRQRIERISSYWSSGEDAYVSHDRASTLVTIQLKSSDEQQRVADFDAIRDQLRAEGLRTRFGGLTAMTQQINAQTGRDIARAEIISIPVLLILMVVAFGGVVAAATALGLGVVVVFGSFLALRIVTIFTPVSTFAINIVTILGLGLAIDYGLLVIKRFREGLDTGLDSRTAASHAASTAGRAVYISAATVAVSLACLTLLPARFLSSMGYAGVAVVLFAALSSTLLLPVVLATLGPRIDRGAVKRFTRTSTSSSGLTSLWERAAHIAVRRPVAVLVMGVLVLLAASAPALSANWARPGDWVLSPTTDARAVTNTLATDFDADPSKIMTMVVSAPAGSSIDMQSTDSLAHEISTVRGVTSAETTGHTTDAARITIGYRSDPQSRAASDTVTRIRDVAENYPGIARLTGMPASRADIVSMVSSRIAWMILVAAAAIAVVMFVAFRSILLPIKAIFASLLSLSAALGLLVVLFQGKLFEGLLGFTSVGAIDINFPVLIIAIAFGLAMDYEIFLLSRLYERRYTRSNVSDRIVDASRDSGGVISSAALLFIAVVIGFAFSDIVFMKMIAIGLILAVVIDVTIVRGFLVPAPLALLGDRMWWPGKNSTAIDTDPIHSPVQR